MPLLLSGILISCVFRVFGLIARPGAIDYMTDMKFLFSMPVVAALGFLGSVSGANAAIAVTFQNRSLSISGTDFTAESDSAAGFDPLSVSETNSSNVAEAWNTYTSTLQASTDFLELKADGQITTAGGYSGSAVMPTETGSATATADFSVTFTTEQPVYYSFEYYLNPSGNGNQTATTVLSDISEVGFSGGLTDGNIVGSTFMPITGEMPAGTIAFTGVVNSSSYLTSGSVIYYVDLSVQTVPLPPAFFIGGTGVLLAGMVVRCGGRLVMA
jgi:hypothetical protein